jgi:hypothetical protein
VSARRIAALENEVLGAREGRAAAEQQLQHERMRTQSAERALQQVQQQREALEEQLLTAQLQLTGQAEWAQHQAVGARRAREEGDKASKQAALMTVTMADGEEEVRRMRRLQLSIRAHANLDYDRGRGVVTARPRKRNGKGSKGDMVRRARGGFEARALRVQLRVAGGGAGEGGGGGAGGGAGGAGGGAGGRAGGGAGAMVGHERWQQHCLQQWREQQRLRELHHRYTLHHVLRYSCSADLARSAQVLRIDY